MIQIKHIYANFLEIYSNNDKKILETTNGQLWNTDIEHPIAVSKERYNDLKKDYIEINEPIDKIPQYEDAVEDITEE